MASAIAAPVAARAQQPGKVYRIGAVWTTPNPRMEEVLRQGLRELGWVEGQNVIFEHRYSEGRNERHAAQAAELLRLQPDLIIAVGTPATLAAREATTTIPVVFILVADPVGQVWSEAWLDPAETSQGPLAPARNSSGSIWSFSKRLFPRSPASAS
jgi:putative ABC transport system substrate-binding protein